MAGALLGVYPVNQLGFQPVKSPLRTNLALESRGFMVMDVPFVMASFLKGIVFFPVPRV